MTGENRGNFSAVDASLGYLYQVRIALLLALRRLKSDPNFLVGIETLDDVVFESGIGDPQDILQTKHHRNAAASLADASPDLWKTLRIWFSGRASGVIPASANLFLVTTGTVPSGSASSCLMVEARDINTAIARLDSTARSSTNQALAPAYQVYLAADVTLKRDILSKVTIVDSSPNVGDLGEELCREIFWAVDKYRHDIFLDHLEGWWLRQVLRQLSGDGADRIGGVELEEKMSDLRENFKRDSLPIDDDLVDFSLDEATQAAHGDSKFVHQLSLAKAGKGRISAAIRDYYRAYEQRSRWLRDDLVVGLELSKYEKRLEEEWDLVFSAMRDELGEQASEEQKESAARSVLAWAERHSNPIRPGVTEPFVVRGSLHMLADEVRIGWHPEFRDRLEAILSGSGVPV